MIVFSIAAAAFLGAALRAAATDLDGSFNRQLAGTLVVNVVGAFALGAVVAADVSNETFRVVGVGALGALTTFSTAVSQIECMASQRGALHSIAVAAGSLALVLAAAWCGMQL